MVEEESQGEPGPSPESASLEAEANAALNGAPAQELLPGESPPSAPVQQEWLPFLRGITPLLFVAVLPQWELTPEEKDQWVTALASCCDQLFPGGPDGKYACWVQLIGSTVLICGARMMQNGGKLPPFGPKRIAAANDGTAKAA